MDAGPRAIRASGEIAMRKTLRAEIVVRDDGWLPTRLRMPLATAATATDVWRAIAPLLQRLGFGGVSYFVGTHDHGAAGSPRLAWSSAGSAWVARYRERGYEAVDPRLTEPRSLTPFLWDRERCPDRKGLGRFLDDADRHGIRSGVVVTLRDARDRRIVVALDSAIAPLTRERVEEILENLGEIMLLATTLHDAVLGPRFAQHHHRRALTGRESACLGFAAHGLTSADIGGKLGITERTVNFHVGNAIRKLGALNRPEAIAKGIASGLVRVNF
jgi:DNA-binding CsgD family transcriptional regulator